MRILFLLFIAGTFALPVYAQNPVVQTTNSGLTVLLADSSGTAEIEKSWRLDIGERHIQEDEYEGQAALLIASSDDNLFNLYAGATVRALYADILMRNIHGNVYLRISAGLMLDRIRSALGAP
jgi:hypothetical protein